MDVFATVKSLIEKMVKEEFPSVVNISTLTVELPKDKAHGDVATNAALVLGAQTGKPPAEIANILSKRLAKEEMIRQVKVAGPGFINLCLHNNIWWELIKSVVEAGGGYGDNDSGKGVRINVEYVSANPTGPLHVGHARAIFGDVLARLLKKCGYDVTKEYYINDAGGQINTLAESIFIRYKQALGHEDEIGAGMYPGEYLVPIGQALVEKYGSSLLQMQPGGREELIKEFAVKSIMEIIKADLKDMGIEHDVFISEKHDLLEKNKIEQALKLLEGKGLIYKGILEAPKGKAPEDWEPREQTLFKATEFGDEVDRPILKSDGTYTYFAADIAYHLDKIQRGFGKMVLVLGADHGGYIKRIKAIVAALSERTAKIEIKIMQLVNLYKNNQPFKMSKRSGNFITIRDVLSEVGKDVLRFVMLTRKNDTVLDFHFEKVLEQSRDNPVFYVQYAHARANSVLRLGAEQGLKPCSHNLHLLNNEADLALIKKIAQFPKIVKSAAITYEPHHITYYLWELANEFHSCWAKGNENEGMRFIVLNAKDLSEARLFLAKALAVTIAAGLDVLGVSAVERM